MDENKPERSKKGKARESRSNRVKCYKKWVAHDNEIVNHTVVTCRGRQQTQKWWCRPTLQSMTSPVEGLGSPKEAFKWPFSKIWSPSFYDANQFATHNTDIATRWPWYVPAEIGKFNILASNRLHDMFEGCTSISFSWQIQPWKGGMIYMTSSQPFC